MADVVASFRARSLPVRLGGAHVRASNGTDTGLDGTLSVVSSNVPAFDRDRGVVLGAGATQSLYNTGFAGGVSGTPGTTPTGWTRGSAGAGGTRTFTAIDLGLSCRFTTVNSTDREQMLFAVAVTSGQTVTHSIKCYVHSADTVVDHVISRSNAVAASVTYRVDGVTATTATALSIGWHTVEMIHVFSATGAEAFRFGAGSGFSEARPAGGVDVTIQYPQTEVGAFRSSYIYNTSTSAALLRQPSYISSTLSALGVASQNIGYTLAGVVQFPFAKGVPESAFPRLMGVGATAASDRFEITCNPNTGRMYAGVLQAGSSIGECSTTAGEIDWAVEEPVFFAASWGTANGLILVTRKPDGTTYVDTNTGAALKTALANPMTHAAIQGHIETGAWSNTGGTATWRGALVADRAYSQAELEALSVDDFLPTNTGTYIEDDWIDTTGTLATAHTIRRKRGSEAWTYTDSFGGTGSSSSITVQGNRIQFGSAHSSIVTDLGETDYTLEFPWHIGSTSGERLAIPIRRTDINNQYYLNLREPNDDWTIYKIAGGVQTPVATGSYTFNTSTTYMVKIVVSGTSVHAYINDVSLTGAQTMDTSLTATKAGLGTAGSTTAVTFGTVRFHNGVQLAATGDIDPDGGGALTLAGFVAAPDEAYYREIAADLDGTPTTSSAVVNIPLLDFQPDGDHETTRWRTDYELVLSDGLDTLVQYAQVDPILTPNAEDFTLTSGASVVGDYNPVSGAVGGDDFFTHWHNGDGVRDKGIAGLSDAGSGYMVPSTLPAQGRRMAYDVSAGAWLGYVDTALFSVPPSGGVVRYRVYVGISVGV